MVRLALGDLCHEQRFGGLQGRSPRTRENLYIASHLGDPELSLAKLARSTGCTKRYLHMAFQPEEISISDYILKQRVERCREDLLNPAFAHRSITEIAFSWGSTIRTTSGRWASSRPLVYPPGVRGANSLRGSRTGQKAT